MVGSLHIYSDGYGYGKRIPTERNRMTVPANVPKYRHLPDSEDFLKGCSSTKVIKDDDRSLQRNADAICFQTSGGYGQHYLGIEPTNLRLQRTGISPAQTIEKEMMKKYVTYNHQTTKFIAEPSAMTGRSDISGSLYTDRSPQPSYRDTTYHINNNNSSSGGNNAYIRTLKNLDQSFDRRAKKDLVAATLPEKSVQELVWCATSNDHNAQQSKQWSNYLRRESNNN